MWLLHLSDCKFKCKINSNYVICASSKIKYRKKLVIEANYTSSFFFMAVACTDLELKNYESFKHINWQDCLNRDWSITKSVPAQNITTQYSCLKQDSNSQSQCLRHQRWYTLYTIQALYYIIITFVALQYSRYLLAYVTITMQAYQLD